MILKVINSIVLYTKHLTGQELCQQLDRAQISF